MGNCVIDVMKPEVYGFQPTPMIFDPRCFYTSISASVHHIFTQMYKEDKSFYVSDLDLKYK